MTLAWDRRAGEQGFALLIVLWTLALLALFVTRLAASGRSEARLAANLRRAAAAEAIADAGISEAAFGLLSGKWSIGEPAHVVRLPQGSTEVWLQSETGKIGINSVPQSLLQSVLHDLGASPARARSLAAAIVDWRTPGDDPQQGGAKLQAYRAAGLPYGPPGDDYQSLDELGLVLGMTPELTSRLKPLLTLQFGGAPDLQLADPIIVQATTEAAQAAIPGAAGASADDPLLVSVTSTATSVGGGHFTRRAILRIKPAQGRMPYQILTWESPAP